MIMYIVHVKGHSITLNMVYNVNKEIITQDLSL
jgi:nickel-dependent lactate racemase